MKAGEQPNSRLTQEGNLKTGLASFRLLTLQVWQPVPLTLINSLLEHLSAIWLNYCKAAARYPLLLFPDHPSVGLMGCHSVWVLSNRCGRANPRKELYKTLLKALSLSCHSLGGTWWHLSPCHMQQENTLLWVNFPQRRHSVNKSYPFDLGIDPGLVYIWRIIILFIIVISDFYWKLYHGPNPLLSTVHSWSHLDHNTILSQYW